MATAYCVRVKLLLSIILSCFHLPNTSGDTLRPIHFSSLLLSGPIGRRLLRIVRLLSGLLLILAIDVIVLNALLEVCQRPIVDIGSILCKVIMIRID